jgi:hypothetical protein
MMILHPAAHTYTPNLSENRLEGQTGKKRDETEIQEGGRKKGTRRVLMPFFSFLKIQLTGLILQAVNSQNKGNPTVSHRGVPAGSF